MIEDRELNPKGSGSSADDDALDWLLRKDGGPWSAEDQSQFDTWLESAWANRVAYWRYDAAWSRAGRLSAMQKSSPAPRVVTTKRAKQILLGIVAIVAVILGGFGATYLLPSSAASYATGIGQTRTIALDDGSHLELNTDTAVNVVLSRDRRIVRIDKGEVYFDILHNSLRPFTVVAGNGRILDLGTKFLVRREVGRVQVSLFEGRAQFSMIGKDAHAGEVSLSPGDIAVATPTSFAVTKESAPVLHAALEWRRGLITFDDTPLSEVAVEFNRYNRVKLIVAGHAAENITVGGTFTARDVEAFSRVASNVLGLHVEKIGDEILISR